MGSCLFPAASAPGAPTAAASTRTLRTLLFEMLSCANIYTHIRILQRSNLDRRNWARYLRQQKTKDWSFTNFKLFPACFKNFRTRKKIKSSRQPSQKATSCISRLHKRLSPFHKLSGFKYDIVSSKTIETQNMVDIPRIYWIRLNSLRYSPCDWILEQYLLNW